MNYVATKPTTTARTFGNGNARTSISDIANGRASSFRFDCLPDFS